MFNYDYTFCADESCPHTDCLRHDSRTPVGVPVSVSDLRVFRDENGCCDEYIPVEERRDMAWYVKQVEEKKMLLKDACAEMGISRQTWYNRLEKMRNPREPKKVGRPRIKQEVVPEETPKVDAVVIDWEGVKIREAAEQREWMSRISDATDYAVRTLGDVFPGIWCNLRFDHVDSAAYWFSFELVHDSRRQIWSVRHTDF